jgi:AraC-like DNA-binding protein
MPIWQTSGAGQLLSFANVSALLRRLGNGFRLWKEFSLTACAALSRAIPPYRRTGCVRTGGDRRLGDVARDIGLCQRRFIHVFTAQVGLTRKLFCRLLRFQRARSLMDRIERLDWGQLALTCGYFDQSHFINDFQEFSSSNPTGYLRQHQQDDRLKTNHLVLPA